ncbi:MAG TPA: bifunctional diguanylate cyclase/phosphodiesterase [Acidimicrobiales bacterium]|nr:bifunctional diguanylate cyclase/phosphodiesterase [Acidimicrobiales bacterium]
MPSPHLELLRAIDAGVVLYRTDPTRPAEDPVVADVNAAARRLRVRTDDHGMLEGVRRAATFALEMTLTDLDTDAPGSRVDARVHPLDDGWVGVVLTPSSGRDTTGRDALTGLGDRAHFLELLGTALAAGPVTAVLVDLDRLQEVNDTLGHAQGDALLRQSGARLRRLPFATAEPCRIGSDEFGLVVELRGRAPELVATQVAAAFSAPFVLGRLSVRATASVGIAVGPEHGRTASELLRSADIALSTAKTDRGTALYRPDRDPFDLRRLQLLAGLRDAIADGALTLEYQPKLDLATGRMAGVEALVRWHHAELGEIAPSEFVPLAEDRGLIGALSQWVLGESGRQCEAWNGHGLDIDVSANISAQNLYDPGLVRWLGRLFEDGRVAPGQLTLELTESQIVSDLPMAGQLLQRLKGMGVNLSIDDFGTGYSSLSYLAKLPLDELKIDRSFVLDLEAGDQGRALVQTIIDLGHGLGLRIVAEGVESDATISTLQSLGCDQVQGFHLSRPLSADGLESWLMAQSMA